MDARLVIPAGMEDIVSKSLTIVKRGMLRLWASLSIIWVVVGISIILYNKNSHITNTDAARIWTGIINKNRKELRDFYYNKSKESNIELNKAGIKIPFDDTEASNQAYDKSWDDIRKTDDYIYQQESLSHAAEAEGRRNDWIKYTIIAPPVLGILMLLFYWTFSGFTPNKPPTN